MKVEFSNIILMAYCCCSCWAQKMVSIDLKNIVEPQHYIVYQTENAIKIDGKAIEKDWQTAAFSPAFVDIADGDQPHYNTQVKMLWDKQYLYVYAQLEEPHVWGNLTEHDAVIFYNNDFEVFIDPTDDTYNYSEIEVNALNTTWDLCLDKPYRFGGGANDYYEIKGLKTAVYIEGTLNNPNDLDQYWAVEMAIPLEVILKRKRKKQKQPKNGDYWRVNFSRVQWEHSLKEGIYERKKVDGKFLPEYNWVWSKQGVVNMHLPERWGYIEFSKNFPSQKKEPLWIEQKLSKQVAYALLEAIKFGQHKNLLTKDVGDSQKIAPISIQNENFDCTFIKTYLGFEIHVYNQTLKKEFVVNEMGQFRCLN